MPTNSADDKSAELTSMPSITRSEFEPFSGEGGRPGQVVKLLPQHAYDGYADDNYTYDESADDKSADDSVEERYATRDSDANGRLAGLVSDIVGRLPEAKQQQLRDLVINEPARFHQQITDFWLKRLPLSSALASSSDAEV